MSFILTGSIDEATSILKGETSLPGSDSSFVIEEPASYRFHGFEPAPGASVEPVPEAWEKAVRGLWTLGATWGLAVSAHQGRCEWRLLLPRAVPEVPATIAASLCGARLARESNPPSVATQLREFHHQTALAGHPGTGLAAGLHNAVQALLETNFLIVVLAKPLPEREIEEERARLAEEEQFLREEYLSRPGLEAESNSPAAHYLELLKASIDRIQTSLTVGAWRFRCVVATDGEPALAQARALIHAAFSKEGGMPEPLRWQDIRDPRGLTVVDSSELAALTRPPRSELPGFQIDANGRHDGDAHRESGGESTFSTSVPTGQPMPSVTIGRVVTDTGSLAGWLDLPLHFFCRHLLVAGMPGSGKSVSCEHIVLELWREHGIPSLVLEPGLKAAYRRLLRSEIGSDIQIFAPGSPDAGLLPLNPLAAPPGIAVSEHADGLFSVLSSAFELVPPMPEVLARAIANVYRRHGWDMNGWVPDGLAPEFHMLIEEVDRLSGQLGYSGEVSGNIRAGLLLRLERLARGILSREIGAYSGPDTKRLLSQPTLVELSGLSNADSQSLVMGLLSLQLRHHWRLAGPSRSLRHLTVVEEAHRMLRLRPDTPANAARNRAVEDLAHMLAELRAFGAGLAIVDQSPSELAPAVIANTGTKLVHRLDLPADRDLAGRSAGLPPGATDLLGNLHVGEAVFKSDLRARPFHLKMPNPSVTYEPETLTSGPPQGIKSYDHSPCPVCGKPHCDAFDDGNRTRGISLIESFRHALKEGEDAAWFWAVKQSHRARSGRSGADPDKPLCFLVGMATAAGLSDQTIQRITSAFLPRTKPSE